MPLHIPTRKDAYKPLRSLPRVPALTAAAMATELGELGAEPRLGENAAPSGRKTAPPCGGWWKSRSQKSHHLETMETRLVVITDLICA